MNEVATRDDSTAVDVVANGVEDVTLEPMTREQAVEFVHAVKVADRDQFWRLVLGFVRRVHEALGYSDWDSFYENEIGELHFKLSRTMRREAVAALANPREVLGIDANGYSNSVIARLIGVTEGTVRGDIKELRKKIEIPSERVGHDGRSRRDPIRQLSVAVLGNGDDEPETKVSVMLPATPEEAYETMAALDEVLTEEDVDEGEPEADVDEGEPEADVDEGEPEAEADEGEHVDVGTVQRQKKSTADVAVEMVGSIHTMTDKLNGFIKRKSVDWTEIGTPDVPGSGDVTFYQALVDLESAARVILNAVEHAHERVNNTIDAEIESEDG